MPDWYMAHQADIQDWIAWGLAYDAFRKLSALMYVIFAVGLFTLGAQYHAAVIRKEPGPGQFPEGYFTMLTIQLVPLTITGFVLQDAVLFPGTIRENIAYGRPGAADEEIVAAAGVANADEFIGRMPRGYDTIVGEHGNTLSGGQRQRIAIARAVIRNSPILVLDEPTAALDAESEHLVIDGLRRLMKGRTVIMIAHRLSTLIDADKIVVLKHGIVAEEGSHADLIARGGIFADLHRIQFQHASAA